MACKVNVSDALDLWFGTQRKLWWKCWRWLVVVLVVIAWFASLGTIFFLLTVSTDYINFIAFEHKAIWNVWLKVSYPILNLEWIYIPLFSILSLLLGSVYAGFIKPPDELRMTMPETTIKGRWTAEFSHHLLKLVFVLALVPSISHIALIVSWCFPPVSTQLLMTDILRLIPIFLSLSSAICLLRMELRYPIFLPVAVASAIHFIWELSEQHFHRVFNQQHILALSSNQFYYPWPLFLIGGLMLLTSILLLRKLRLNLY